MIFQAIFILHFWAFAKTTPSSTWTNQSTSALVTSFDSKCVEVKITSGKKFSLKREGFKNMKLIAGTTQVLIHPESLEQSLCAK